MILQHFCDYSFPSAAIFTKKTYSITDKQYPTKEDATIAALQGWMQSKSHGGYVAHLAKKAMIKYQNETLQLSLF